MKQLFKSVEAVVIGIVIFAAIVMLTMKWTTMPFDYLVETLKGDSLAQTGFVLSVAFALVLGSFFKKAAALINQGPRNKFNLNNQQRHNSQRS